MFKISLFAVWLAAGLLAPLPDAPPQPPQVAVEDRAPEKIDSATLGSPVFDEPFTNPIICDDHLEKCPAKFWRPILGSGGVTSLDNRNGSEAIMVDRLFPGVENGKLGDRPLGLDPFTIDGRGVTITARPAPPEIQSKIWDHRFISGMLSSKFIFQFVYGYVEVVADLPTCVRGAWPGIWTVASAPTGWPKGGEIDFPEDVGDGRHYFTLQNATTPKFGYQDSSIPPEKCDRGLHRYGAIKTPKTVAMYYDGQRVAQYSASPDMNVPHQIILDLFMGGRWVRSKSGPPGSEPVTMTIRRVSAWSYPLNAGR